MSRSINWVHKGRGQAKAKEGSATSTESVSKESQILKKKQNWQKQADDIQYIIT